MNAWYEETVNYAESLMVCIYYLLAPDIKKNSQHFQYFSLYNNVQVFQQQYFVALWDQWARYC